MKITPPRVQIPGSDTPSDRYGAVAASLLFHAILIFILLWNKPLVESVFLEGDLGGGGGGSGGPESTLISLAGPPEPPPPVVPTPPVQPDPVPTPTPTPVPPPPKDTVKTPPAPTPSPVPAPVTTGTAANGGDAGAGSAGSGGGAGGGTGGGVGTGNGTGTGAGSGGGTGGGATSPDGLIPPSPTALMLQPTPPGNLRGRTVIVDLEIDPSGKVTEVQVKQSSGNSKYDSQLKKTAAEWRFHPARNRQGQAVTSVFQVTFTL
jgi:protein TonB